MKDEIIEKIGEFDERFDKPHFREDTDFAWRVQKYGLIPFAKDVPVYHPPVLRKLKGKTKKEEARNFKNDSFRSHFIHDALLFVKHPEKYIKLMRATGHYKNKNFWRIFLDGCKRINDKIPVELLLKDPEISKYVPDELKEKEWAQKKVRDIK